MPTQETPTQESWTSVAARQLGVVTRQQLFSCRITRHQVDGLLRMGRLTREQPGVFVVAGSPDSWERMVLVGVLAAGSGAVASPGSAAFLHGLAGAARSRPEITLPGSRLALVRRCTVHRTLVFPEEDVTRLGPVPVTAVARTLVDLSGALSLGRLARALDDALVRNLAHLSDVRRCAERLAPGPGRSLSKLRVLLAERGGEARLAESRPEMRVMRVIVGAGLPAPVQQHVVRVNGERFRLDFAYPDQMVGLEYQGFDPHRSRSAFDRDYRRDRLLRGVGWDMRYFTSATTDAEIVQTVAALVA